MHHYILISHIMKVLMLVNVFYALPPTKPFPLAHSLTSFAWFSPWIISPLMISTISKSTAPPWVLKWLPVMPTFFLVFSKQTLWKNAPFQPHTWLRYIDDIFMIWTEGLDILKIFIDYLNNIRSTIKFTSSQSSTNITFLDVNVSLTNDGNISTDLYTKPTDKHQHLLYSSCHPLHTKKAITFSLALRLRRICSVIHHSLTSLTSSKNISICCSPVIATKASFSIRLL